jgi:pimeloyl-ACP methyl ester carboxylesterase
MSEYVEVAGLKIRYER